MAAPAPPTPHACANPELIQASSSTVAAWRRSGGAAAVVALPPLPTRAPEQQLDGSEPPTAGSPTLRRSLRKAELLAFALGRSPGGGSGDSGASPGAGLLLELEAHQGLVKQLQHRTGRLVLEAWLEDALGRGAAAGAAELPAASLARGAASAGLSRQQLLAAGLGAAGVDSLHRAMYVYSAGFVDAVKELLVSCEQRQQLLPRIWRAFLVLAEQAMKASFKSDYATLVNAAGSAMTELLWTQQALSEVRRDNAALVKDVGSLSASEAEATAQRHSIKSQAEQLAAALALERTAHQRAVQQYVDALDARAAMQLQLEAAQQQLGELSADHAALAQQHGALRTAHDALVGQCRGVRDVFWHVDGALALDQQLEQQLAQLAQQTAQPPDGAAAGAAAGAAPGPRPPTAEHAPAEDASDMQPLAERLRGQVEGMYACWRAAVDSRDAAVTQRFRMGDELRSAQEQLCEAGRAQRALQQALGGAQELLAGSQAEAADLSRRLSAAHKSLAQHQIDLGEAQGQLQHTLSKAAAFERRSAQLEDALQQLREEAAQQAAERAKLEAAGREAAVRLAAKHRLMAEASKGFAVSLQSLWAQQTARRVLLTQLTAERANCIHMHSSLEGKDVLLRDLQAQVADQAARISTLQSDAALLEAALQDSQRQAMSLGSRLSLADAKNDELVAQVQGQAEQLGDAASKIGKLSTKLQLGSQALDKQARDIRELREAAQVCERLLSESRLLAKSLSAEVERLTREKQSLSERSEATKARLALELQRVTGELAAADRKLELAASDLAAERDRVAATGAVLERKRGKKRRWKAAYDASSSEVASLHTTLLAKHKELETLESLLRRLHTELLLLSAGTGTSLAGARRPTSAAASAAGGPGSQGGSRPGSAGAPPFSPTGAAGPVAAGASSIDLAAARAEHQAAADELAHLGRECLVQDRALEQAAVEQQQLLLSLAGHGLSSEHIHTTQAAAAAKLLELQELRHRRAVLEDQRGAAGQRLRAAEAALRDVHHARLQQRQATLERHAMQAADLVNAAGLAQLAAAEEAELSARAALSTQLDAFEAAQADKAAMAQRMTELQDGIQAFVRRISGLEGERAVMQEQLKRSGATINALQAEIAAVNAERERIRSSIAHSEQRIAALESELEVAKQAVTAAIKGLEAKHAADRQVQEQRLGAERSKAAAAAKAADALVGALRSRIAHLRAALDSLAAHMCGQPSSGAAASGSSRLAAEASSVSASSDAAALLDQQQAPSGAAGGERWLYQHLSSGPWAAARQLLQQPEPGVDALSRLSQSSSGASTPRQPGARVIGQPPSLPGLCFSADMLLVLLGELMLAKVDADAASSASLLSAAAAAEGSVASRAPSRPATAGSPTAGAGALEAAGEVWISGGVGAVAAWWAARARRDLEAVLFDAFLARFGSRLAAEAHCSALVLGVRKAASRSKRARLFGRWLGVLQPAVAPAGVGACLHFLAHLHASCGPLTGEAAEGCSQVLCRTAAQLALQVLQPTAAPPCAELAALPAAFMEAAGGRSDSSLELDDALELVLAAWTAQRSADASQLERVAAGHLGAQGGGLLHSVDGFAALLAQVAPGAAQQLSSEQLHCLFLAALRASGAGCAAAGAVSTAGFSAALLDAGLLGSGSHLRRHPPIAQRPPFSEFRLLQASWHAVKPALGELLRTLPRAQLAAAPELAEVPAQMRRLDDALAACSSPGEAWSLYRHLLGAYSQHGSFPEASITPATPRTASSSLPGSVAATPRGAAAFGARAPPAPAPGVRPASAALP